MVIKKSGIVAALLGAMLAIAQVAPGYVTQGILRESWSWLPQLGTAGRTVVLYTYLGHAIGFVVGVAAVFAVGYLAGRRLDFRTNYRQFVAILAFGGGAGYGVILFALVAPGLVSGEIAIRDGTSVVRLVVAGRILAVSIQFAIIGFAGAAFTALIKSGPSDRTAIEPSESRVGSE